MTSSDDAFSTNPILSLAKRSWQKALDYETWLKEVHAIVETGSARQHLVETFEALKRIPASETQAGEIISQVGGLCGVLNGILAEREGRARITALTVEVLAARHNDRDSLLRALSLSAEALQFLAIDCPEYGLTLMNEACARQNLARLGGLREERKAYLSRAIELYEHARRIFAPNRDLSLVHGVNAQASQADALVSLSALGVQPGRLLARAFRGYEQVRQRLAPDNPNHGFILCKKAEVLLQVAKLGMKPVPRLRRALQLYAEVRPGLTPDSPDYGRTFISEGVALEQLVQLGAEPPSLLENAIGLFGKARAYFESETPDYGLTLLNEASALVTRAKTGVEPKVYLTQAAELNERARSCFATDSCTYVLVLVNQAIICERLAELGLDSPNYLAQALELYERARESCIRNTPEYGFVLRSEATTRAKLAEFGENPLHHLEQAVQLNGLARQCFQVDTPDYGFTLMNEAITRARLAELGAGRQQNLMLALALHAEARRCFQRGTPDHGLTLMNEANTQLSLAKFGTDPRDGLAQALDLYERVRPCFAPGSPAYNLTLTNEASALIQLAALGITPTSYLLRSIELCGHALSGSTPDTPAYGLILMAEASARMTLAQFEADPTSNLEQAASLYFQARQCLVPGSSDWGTCHRNHAHTLRALAERNPLKRNETLHKARTMLEDGLRLLELTRSRMRREKDRIAFLETVADQYAAMVEVCLKLAEEDESVGQPGTYYWEAWHWAHRCKSRTLLELLSNVSPRLSEAELPLWEKFEARSLEVDEAERALLQFVKDMRQGRLSSSPSTELGQAPWLTSLTQRYAASQSAYLAARHNVLEHLEGARELVAVDVPPPKESLRHLRSLAEEGSRTVLIEFLTLHSEEIVAFLVPVWMDRAPLPVRIKTEPATLRQLTMTLLSAAGKLSQETRACRGGAEEHAANPQELAEAKRQFESLPAEIGDLLVPILERLETEGWWPTSLVFAPHFLLNLLPLHSALWQGLPIIERWPISYLPSGALAGVVAGQTKPPTAETLLFGNPTGDLFGAEQEVRWIKEILKTAGFTPHSLLRDQVTTDRVKELAPCAGIIHGAVHAVLEVSDFYRSGMELSDRRFTVLDAWQLQMKHAILIYLSSCQSGQAVPGRTDELLTLVRPLLKASSVIATLWPLTDDAGCAFATHFYKRWAAGDLTLGQAFQQATQETRKQYNNPFHWAPLVLFGAWRAYLTPPHGKRIYTAPTS